MKTAKFTHNGIEYEVDIPEPETSWLRWIVLLSDRSPTWLPIRWDPKGQVASVMKIEDEQDVLRARPVNPSPVAKKSKLSDYRFMYGGHEYQIDMVHDDRLQAHRVDALERPPCTCPALRAEGAAPCARHGWVYVPKETAAPSVEQTEIVSLRHRLELGYEEIARYQREMRRANDRLAEGEENIRDIKTALEEVRAERDRLRTELNRWAPKAELERLRSEIAQMKDRHDEDQRLLKNVEAQWGKAIADRNDEARMLLVSREDVRKLTQDMRDIRDERDALREHLKSHQDSLVELDRLREKASACEHELQWLRERIHRALSLSKSPSMLGYVREMKERFDLEPELHEQVMRVVFDLGRALDRNKSDEGAMGLQMASNRLACDERDKARAELAAEREQVGMLKHALEEAQKELRTFTGIHVPERRELEGQDLKTTMPPGYIREGMPDYEWGRWAVRINSRTGSEPNRTAEPGGLTALLVRTEEERDGYRSALEEALTDLRVLTGHEPKTTQSRSELLAIIEGMREQLRAKDAEIRQYQRARGWEPDEVTPEILRGSFVAMEEKIRELSTKVNESKEKAANLEDGIQFANTMAAGARKVLDRYLHALKKISEMGKTCERFNCKAAKGVADEALDLTRTEAQSGS